MERISYAIVSSNFLGTLASALRAKCTRHLCNSTLGNSSMITRSRPGRAPITPSVTLPPLRPRLLRPLKSSRHLEADSLSPACSHNGYSSFIVHWEIRKSMTEADVEIILQRAKEKYPNESPSQSMIRKYSLLQNEVPRIHAEPG